MAIIPFKDKEELVSFKREIIGEYPERSRLHISFERKDKIKYEGETIEIPAGTRGCWTLKYMHKGPPIDPQGGVLITRYNFTFGSNLQDANPKGHDYVTIGTSSNAELKYQFKEAIHNRILFYMRVSKGKIQEGEDIVIHIGDMSEGGMGSAVHYFNTEGIVMGAVDRKGDNNFLELKGSPIPVTITACKEPDYYRMTMPSVIKPGLPFTIWFTAWDMYRNLCTEASGSIKLFPEGEFQGLPQEILLTEKNKGLYRIDGISIRNKGVNRIQFEDEKGGIKGWSNPVLCGDHEDIFWGDLHCHAWGDKGNYAHLHTQTTDPVIKHNEIERLGLLDFSAMGPMNKPDEDDMPGLWKAYRKRKNTEGSHYISFLSTEVHPRTGGGDRQVFFLHDEEYPPDADTPIENLYKRYENRDDVIIETHVGGGAADWERFRPGNERILEIASGHGNFEWFLQEALQYGYKPAVIGASDAHLELPGSPKGLFHGNRYYGVKISSAFRGGPLAAVFSPHLEKNSIWRSIEEKRTYATTGARIILLFSVNKCGMGKELIISEPPEISFQIYGTNIIENVSLIRGDRLVETWTPDTMDFAEKVIDRDIPLGKTWYYLRVTQTDREYAWSTPVWVENKSYASKANDNKELPSWNYFKEVDLRSIEPNNCGKYIEDLVNYLQDEGCIDKFSHITPMKVVNETQGTAALFYGYLEPEHQPVSIYWYYELELPCIHLEPGWCDFGSVKILPDKAKWSVE